ncbi:hypothetical protein GW17_00010220 [Ensete ventricosum]|nr:hypothetical protein GW17_00010220 [Ensete ventricosum]
MAPKKTKLDRRSKAKAKAQPASADPGVATFVPVNDASAGAETIADGDLATPTLLKRNIDLIRVGLATSTAAIETLEMLADADEDEQVIAMIVVILGDLEMLFFGYSNKMKLLAWDIKSRLGQEGGHVS